MDSQFVIYKIKKKWYNWYYGFDEKQQYNPFLISYNLLVFTFIDSDIKN